MCLSKLLDSGKEYFRICPPVSPLYGDNKFQYMKLADFHCLTIPLTTTPCRIYSATHHKGESFPTNHQSI